MFITAGTKVITIFNNCHVNVIVMTGKKPTAAQVKMAEYFLQHANCLNHVYLINPKRKKKIEWMRPKDLPAGEDKLLEDFILEGHIVSPIFDLAYRTENQDEQKEVFLEWILWQLPSMIEKAQAEAEAEA
jgi:hypothetical protein